jgi:SpoIID/LytB domain protein
MDDRGATDPGRIRIRMRVRTRARSAIPRLLGSALACCLAMAASVIAVTVTAASATDGGSVTITGSGFGHGVGMSQYGAYGMALDGATAPEILRHYFTGTTVGDYPDDVDLRVNVVDQGSQVTLRSVPLAATGGALELRGDGSPVALGTGDVVVVTPATGRLSVTVTRADGSTSALVSSVLGVRWAGTTAMPGPATLLRVDSRGADALAAPVKSRQYRWGSLSLSSVPRTGPDGVARPRIEANALVDLHGEYLRGLAEMPSSWPDAALQAQAVAARNYALAQSGRSMAACGGCALWDDTRSQVYRGWQPEQAPGGARWVRAIAATQTSPTRGLAVLYRGVPITAYYSSSTGGRTRDAASVWGTAVPYLRSVDDRWSVNASINPGYASWTRSVALARVLAAFGLPDLAGLVVTERDAGGAAMTVRATASDGTVRTLSGSTLRSRFGLPAQWVTGFVLPPKP